MSHDAALIFGGAIFAPSAGRYTTDEPVSSGPPMGVSPGLAGGPGRLSAARAGIAEASARTAPSTGAAQSVVRLAI
jgi:hypothetical protein